MNSVKLLIAGLLLGSPTFNVNVFAASAPAPQTVSGGGVTVKVLYLNPHRPEEPRFQIVLDTHSVDLDAYDLKTIAVLRDDTGSTLAPSASEAKGSGHHREVILIFPKLSSEAKRAELLIKDVAGVKERKFEWNLQR